MYWLSPAIALLAGLRQRMAGSIARQIHLVGRVNREHMILLGNRFSVLDTSRQHQSSPAQAASLKKQKAAKRTSVAAKSTSKKQSAVQMEKSQCSLGNSIQTPVSKTSQPVSQAQKPRKEAVLFTQREQSHLQEQAPAQTHTDSQFGVRGKQQAPANKTPQRAKQRLKQSL